MKEHCREPNRGSRRATISSGGIGRLWHAEPPMARKPPCRRVRRSWNRWAGGSVWCMACVASSSFFFSWSVSRASHRRLGHHPSADSSRSGWPAKLHQQPTNFKLTLHILTPTSNRKARLGAVLSLPGVREERTGTPAARPIKKAIGSSTAVSHNGASYPGSG